MARTAAVGTALLGILPLVTAGASAAGAAPEPVRDLSKKAVWMMGTDLGFAAIANALSVSPAQVQQSLTRAKGLAEPLGVTVPDLPKAQADKAKSLAAALAYLMQDCKPTATGIMSKHGAQHAALFELALRLQMLRPLYAPGDSTTDAIRDSIEKAADRAGLPSSTWKPLADSIARKATPADVYAAIDRVTQDVAAHLETAAPAVVESDVRSQPSGVFSSAATPAVRFQIWRTGHSLAAVAVKRALGTNDQIALPLHAATQSSAAKLGVVIPDAPTFVAGATTSQKGAATLRFLLSPGVAAAADAIEAKYGPGARALFDLGLKSQLVGLVYAPGSDFGASLAKGLERAGHGSGLPEALWRPTLTKMNAGAPTEDVVASANRMGEAVDSTLRDAAAKK